MQNTTLFKTLFRKLFTPCMNILKKHVLNFCMCGGELLLQKKKKSGHLVTLSEGEGRPYGHLYPGQWWPRGHHKKLGVAT
jgi:hypothetical protein